jgi:tripartite-type tricarboxylate transporter receptor subunit TctC
MIHKIARRTVLSLALFGISSLAVHAQTAAPYPNRPVKLIVAFAAGGPIDLAARIVAEQLTQKLGQPVVVENKVGANGSIAAEYVKSQPADGHTVLVSNASMITITPTLKKDLKYDVEKDFAPVTRLVTSPLILVVNPENPLTANIRTVKDLVAAAKGAPGQLSYGSAGLNGNVQQLAFELLASESGISFLPVPYKGSSEAQAALFSRTVTLGFDTPTAVQHIRVGKLRPLAVTSKERLKELPDAPTMEELGYKGFEIGFWSGVFLPKATPPAIISRVSQAIIEIGKDPAVRTRLEPLGMITIQTPDQFAAHIKTETNLLADVIKRSNIKPE